MQLPESWIEFLNPHLNVTDFLNNLNSLIINPATIMPAPENVFNVFNFMQPKEVRCVLFGEDPYPRRTSANGVAFWDTEINHWNDKTNGNSLKNILKALLVARGWADYSTPIEKCRQIAEEKQIPQPPELFKGWLTQGVLLINTSMTFAGTENKKQHFEFWQPFHRALIKALNTELKSPFYILWGRKAQNWQADILATIDDSNKIICQGHPTFIHQFLQKSQPTYSPFDEIESKTKLKWL